MTTKEAKTFKTFDASVTGVCNTGSVIWSWAVSYWRNFTESGSRGIKSSEWVSEQTKEHLKRMTRTTRQWSENNQLLCARKIKARFIHELKRVYGSQVLLPAECVRVRFLHVSGESHLGKACSSEEQAKPGTFRTCS